MFRVLGLVALLGLLGTSVGQIIQAGQCNSAVQVQSNFVLENFLGFWYENSRTPNNNQDGDCSLLQISTTLESDTYVVFNNFVTKNFGSDYHGVLRAGDDEPAKLKLSLTSFNNREIDFWVLYTDYNNFALTYSCENIDSETRSINLWKLGRRTSFTELVERLMDVRIMTLFGINATETMETVDHSDEACYELPVIEAGQPIVIPGFCDESVAGIANFDATRFQGRWHQISNYFTQNSVGNCVKADYGLNQDGTVSVVNSQVINQDLLTINGVASVASDDGSGVLTVTLEVAPNVFVESELKILTTDYDNYAISYTCINQNNSITSSPERQVFSWILSRDRDLSTTSAASVSQFIDTIIDLNYRYYSSTDQSDASCFYFPEPEEGKPVVFPGSCDTVGLSGMPNFRVADFMGKWNNIEAYPSPTQTGTCINAEYTLNTEEDRVEVYNTQVENERLVYINGYAVVASDNGNAELEVTFPIGPGVTVSSSYWVMDTDYETYAVVYSCENLPDNERQVWSGKLSRTKTLSAASMSAINTAISGIDVLDERYYESKDQSDDGCFYYPEPVAGQPVVFPGQCDESIAVVPNFNLNEFGGTWYEVEAFPKNTQTGQCINHNFEATTSNAMNLASTRVFDQELLSTAGTVQFTSTDGSAKFNIVVTSSTGAQITIPYWILATDYNNYAVAYSCVNMDSDFRGVWSWKLSRTKQLSATSAAAINEAVSSVQVLNPTVHGADSTYYEPVDQSDAACFYFPDLAPGEEVILPGQCDDTVPVVQNFDAARYIGTWRLIESYPSQFQLGTCGQQIITPFGGNIVVVQNTEVVNSELSEITGTATLAADGSAKLEVVFPPTSATSQLWILATDYDNYSFAYTCTNINSDTRQIGSWKMSRTATLTDESTTAINQVIDNVQVLNNRFYQAVDNSYTGCFYYPEPAENRPVEFRGQCGNTVTQAMPNFNVTEFMGKWNNIEAYPSPTQTGTCINAEYNLNTEEDRVEVYNTQVENERLVYINGYAVVTSDNGNAELQVTFPIGDGTVSSNYWVLDTDYTSYALVYSCDDVSTSYRRVWSGKLSRSKNLSATANVQINNVISNYDVLDARYFEVQNQSEDGCFYYPEPQLGKPVVFPGQCDESITAVPNFNINDFGGIWYEVEAFPKDTKPGQCINHDFTATTSNAMNLVSTRVFEQLLTTTNSAVQFTSTDGSAKFNVVVTSADGSQITIPYWILATDYNNFALAYSCVNIDMESRGVWSWKLSRTKQLSATSAAAINEAVSSVQVLNPTVHGADSTYYEPVDQSDAACFYFPDLASGEEVILPGQCDDTVPVVQNFDAARYIGTWRLIESYPSQFQLGTCGRQTISPFGGNIVVVQNSEVLNSQLREITGTATVAADGSAKLEIYFPGPVPGATGATTELWILDTDYDTYSFAYSCSNLTPETRKIGSWKLSRTRSLTNVAITNINQVIDNVLVLNSRYYENVDQSDESCFYFPDPSLDQPLVFRGQCDESIPAVPNFDVAAYMGLWHEIESYPSDRRGSCSNAYYSLNDDGTVGVYNTEIVGQQLQEINGFAVVASDDGSAKLSVTFPVDDVNVTTSYWVLATDYTSYALVYSCENTGEDQRAVFSWKLSKTQELTAEANTIMDNIINGIQVLDERYYQTKDHSEEGCFFYPDNQGGPVILDGVCEANPNVVTDFDINQFDGLWFEHARFPFDSQEGECVRYEMTFTGPTITVKRMIVYNELQTEITGTLVPSPDGRGILTATFTDPAGGPPLELTLYVLTVKYDAYALLYACENLDQNSKQIYSWKLTRISWGPGYIGNNVIDEIVSENIDLFEGYYKYPSFDDACFHYPDYSDQNTPIILPGLCDESIRGVANFDVERYLGRWFELARYPQEFENGECARATYSRGTDSVTVFNEIVADQNLETIVGSAVVASTDNSGLLDVTFEINGLFNVTSNYYVLGTDYENYALVYSCTDLVDTENVDGDQRRVSSWKLSRERTLDAQYSAIMDDIIENTQGLRESYYRPTSQTDEDCFYVPEVNQEEAVLFRGQCESITGVQSFNAQRFAGWWHEIESYPTGTNVGDCISSNIQSSGNQFLAVDTSVHGLSADVTSSTLQISDDGRLTRVLSNGETFTIWVLATDYDSYALLYSCENVNDEYRRVWSAKHSKTRQLSEASANAIAPIVEANRVLYKQFYQPVDQSDDACFHYPEQSGPVVLPGQCDENIPVEANFDVVQYTGTWYQIEKYDQIFERGTCAAARYTLAEEEGVVDVLNYQVVDGALEEIRGTATVASSDGGAKLTVKLLINGEISTSSLYVLKTDYSSYSLVYSCTNVNDFQRALGVWKLSRTRTMPPAANAEINAIINQRPELHQPYFMPVVQNEDCLQPSSAGLLTSSLVIVVAALMLHQL